MIRLITIEFNEQDEPIGLKEVNDEESLNLVLPQYTDNSEAKNTRNLNLGDWYQDLNGVVKIVQ